MAVHLGKINVDKSVPSQDKQELLMKFMAMNSVARPSSVVVKPQEVQQTIQNSAKK
jgi:hypothetical protein